MQYIYIYICIACQNCDEKREHEVIWQFVCKVGKFGAQNRWKVVKITWNAYYQSSVLLVHVTIISIFFFFRLFIKKVSSNSTPS